MVKLEGFRDFRKLKRRMVRTVQHIYKCHLDLLRLREEDSCKMATTADKGKGLEGPGFSGNDEEYQVWITKFEAYAKVKGF